MNNDLPLDIFVGVKVVFGGKTGVDEALLLSKGGGKLLRGGGYTIKHLNINCNVNTEKEKTEV